jgi:Ca2+-transporting ATPase
LAQITGVGTHTEWGQVMAAISEDNGEETPLQVRLNGAATFIGKVGLSVAILVFIIQFIRYFVTDYKTDKLDEHPAEVVVRKVLGLFTIAVLIQSLSEPLSQCLLKQPKFCMQSGVIFIYLFLFNT